MNTQEYLFSQLGEEASEIAQLCSKTNRFGPNDTWEGTSNVEKLCCEFNDMLGVIIELQARGMLPRPITDDAKILAKRTKIKFWMAHAATKGTLVQ